MNARTYSWLLLALAVILCHAPHAQGEPFDVRDKALRAELLSSLQTLGVWCVKKQLFLARNDLAEIMLTIDEDHEKARGWLRYKRSREGAWVRKTPFKAPKNRKPGFLPEYETQRKAIFDALRPRVIAAIRDAKPVLDPDGRRIAVAFWRTLLGDDPALLALAGLVQHGGTWRPAEDVRALTRKEELRKAAAAAKALRPKLKDRPLPAGARGIDLPWTQGVGTERVAIYGTASRELLMKLARLVRSTEVLMEAQFGGTFETRDYFAIYVMANRAHYAKVVNEHAAIQGDRKLLRDLSGAYIGHGQFIDRMTTPAGTLDSCVSVATQHLLSLRFAKGESRWMPGWVADGFALYNMTWLTGTHLSFTVDFGRYGQDPLFKSLFSRATNWMAKSRALMLSKDPATLRLSLGLKIGRLGPRDFLASYAFVAWLQEARTAAERSALLRLLAEGKDLDKAFAGSLKMTVEQAEKRMIAWLRATADD